MNAESLLFQHPCSCIISGPSKAGKTVFTEKLVQHINIMSTVPPKEIIWCFSEYQTSYAKLSMFPNVRLV